MRMGLICWDLDAELFFDVDEIRGAYWLTEVKEPAKRKINELLRLVAQLSGSAVANPIQPPTALLR
jgi:hypothetical protein